MIALDQLGKTFNRGKINEVVALQDINLKIGTGEFIVIVGANGSGKSTLLNLLSGHIKPSSGKILLNGQNIGQLPEYKRAKYVARVFQDPRGGTAPDLSILDNFRLAALRTKKKQLRIGMNAAFRKKVADIIAPLGLGLENKLHQPMGTLSGGQRQSLTLLMSVMDQTEILLLDEPTAALDPRSSQIVMRTADRIIADYGLTAVFISHNMQEALDYGSRLIQIAKGTIVRDYAGEEKQALMLQDLYSWFG